MKAVNWITNANSGPNKEEAEINSNCPQAARWFRRLWSCALLLGWLANSGWASAIDFTENFNSMGSSTTPPAGWSILTASGGNGTWTASIPIAQTGVTLTTVTPLTLNDAPSANNNNGYNALGLSSLTGDRCIGTAPTGNAGVVIQYASLLNNSGGAITSFDISYDIKRFTAGAGGADELPGYWFFYSVDGGTTWNNVAALNPTLASVPNSAGVTSISNTPVTLSSPWANGGNLLLRWVDDNGIPSSPDQILGLDNVQFFAPAGPHAPSVSITSPTNNATSPTNFTISATAADSGGTVTNVYFYDGVTLLGNDTSSPYSYVWNPAPEGSHELTAVAWDNDGMSATSAVVNVTVSASVNVAPNAPVTIAPANGALSVATNATLTVSVSDSNGDPMSVEFYGRALANVAPGPDFTVVVLPDTQNYSSGYPGIFQSQTDWIVANRLARNIAYVAGVGDIVNTSGSDAEYRNATNALYRLENPATTGLPDGIPYGTAIGNHDLPTPLYNQYFGTDHFAGRSYYGGNYGANNDSHYDLFSASGMDFVVLYITFGGGSDSSLMAWGNNVLQTHANRRAIVVSHSILNVTIRPTPSTWTGEGLPIFDALKANTNLFLMLCGHMHGEGFRKETLPDGRVIDIVLADYQDYPSGGNGNLRIMTFSPNNNQVRVTTYSPYTTSSLTGPDSQFNLDDALSGPQAPFAAVGTSTGIASGSQTSMVWGNLNHSTMYEWYATASDGNLSATGATNRFTTRQAGEPPTVSITSPTNSAIVTTNFTITATASDDGTVTNVSFYDGATLLGSAAQTTNPYTYAWSGAAVGPHVLTAVAWDHTGLSSTSSVVNITVGSPQVQYVIFISVDGLGGAYLSKIFNGTATGGPYAIPNFTRLKNEGASTLAAHCDNNNWETLPNHSSMVTARPRDGVAGHNWSGNGDPAVGQTLHSNKGSYLSSVFDVAHDNGLRTGMYANKSKFSLFDTYGSYTGGGSYNATYGALDTTGVNNGRDKVDNTYINTALGGIIVDTFIAQQKSASPNHYAFLHINEPDANGHGSGWGSATWNSSVVTVDTMLGKIFKLIEQDVPAMQGNTAIILTADHGNQDNPVTGADRYSVPFYVWGPGVAAGADLYALNAGRRQVASSYPMTTYSGVQPIRNAEANNLALELLGLGPIPGSMFGFAQDLVVTAPVTGPQPPIISGITGSAGGQFDIQGTTDVARTLVTEKATNLVAPIFWEKIQTNAVPGGAYSITIPQGADPCAFYRIMSQ